MLIKNFLSDSKNSLDSVLSGYFQAIIASFISKKKNNLLEYLASNEDVFPLVLQRLAVPSICASLKSLLHYIDDTKTSFQADLVLAKKLEEFSDRRHLIHADIREIFFYTQAVEVKENIKELYSHLFHNFPKIIPTSSEDNLLTKCFFIEGFWTPLTTMIFNGSVITFNPGPAIQS